VVAPTSPGWGPVFGGRPAAAAVLAAVDLVVPFLLLVLRLDGVRCFFDEGRVIIQWRAVSKKLPLSACRQILLCPGGGAGDLLWVFANRLGM
jgi:hypothetical protein